MFSLFNHADLLVSLKKHLLPAVLEQAHQPERSLRIWSIGCQKEDEAAALAVLFHVLLGKEVNTWQIKIFATDSNPVACDRARNKMYQHNPLQGTFLQDWSHLFAPTARGYQLVKTVRNLLVFAPHDLFSQAPFPSLDLLICYPSLFSFPLDQQHGISQRFAYALAPGRLLFFPSPDSALLDPSFFSPLTHMPSSTYCRTETWTSFTVEKKTRQLSVAPPDPPASPNGAREALNDFYIEELQAMLEEREVLYQEQEAHAKNLEETNRQLEHLSRLKDDFLLRASHELRTPLAAAIGYGDLLQMALDQQEAASEPFPGLASMSLTPTSILNELLIQLDRLAALLNDLLDVSKVNNDAFALSRRGPWNLLDLISRVARQQAISTGRVITVESASDAVMGTWDEMRLEQVLNNLISNALKYSPPETDVALIVQEGPKPTKGGQVLIKVRDHGCGIAPEDLLHLFDPFYRVHHPDTENRDGFGLGLYIAAEIVKRHGGQIEVDSLPGVGSTFCVSLPLT